MRVRLLKKLRRKYSKGYKMAHVGSYWNIIDGSYRFSFDYKSEKEALIDIRKCIRMKIEANILKRIKKRKSVKYKVTYKMLYG